MVTKYLSPNVSNLIIWFFSITRKIGGATNHYGIEGYVNMLTMIDPD